LRSNSSSGKILSVHNIQVSNRPTWGAEVGLLHRRMKKGKRVESRREEWGRLACMAQTRRTQPSVWMAVELQVLERSGSAIASTCRRPPTSSHRSHLTDCCSPCDFLPISKKERKKDFSFPFCRVPNHQVKEKKKKSPENNCGEPLRSPLTLLCVCVCGSVSI
jgi:hypothetical protein